MDYKNRAASPYDAHIPMHGKSLDPKIGQQNHTAEPTVSRHSSYHQTSAPPPFYSGLGIRVAVKPELRITPPPQLVPQVRDIPRSNFQFDFELERKILAELEKGSENWSTLGLENLPSKTAESTSSPVQEQRRAMRNGENEGVTEEVFFVKASKGKTKIPQCSHCEKHGHEEKDCSYNGKP
ncbi:uncharacterized protein [Euphorbia lathyris]|uniref:uncharacterized protein n=1 Tax=Euphorbia lathyris TaxID=212925 RepID=UPI003313CB49